MYGKSQCMEKTKCMRKSQSMRKVKVWKNYLYEKSQKHSNVILKTFLKNTVVSI